MYFLLSFMFQGCKDYVSNHVCRSTCGAHEHTAEANESDWESVPASSDQLPFGPKGPTPCQWNTNPQSSAPSLDPVLTSLLHPHFGGGGCQGSRDPIFADLEHVTKLTLKKHIQVNLEKSGNLSDAQDLSGRLGWGCIITTN